LKLDRGLLLGFDVDPLYEQGCKFEKMSWIFSKEGPVRILTSAK